MSQKWSKPLVTTALTVGMLSCVVFSAFATPSAKDFDTEKSLIISTDKTTYRADEDINVGVQFDNTCGEDVSNVLVKAKLPDGLQEKYGANLNTFSESVKAGETVSLHFVAVKDGNNSKENSASQSTETATSKTNSTDTKTTVTPTNSVVSPAQDNNNSSNTNNTNNTAANTTAGNGKTIGTGSNMPYVVMLISAAAILAILLFGLRKHKKTTKITSLVLCAALISSTVLPVAKISADNTAEKPYSLKKQQTVTVDGNSYSIEAEAIINFSTGNDSSSTPVTPDPPVADGPYTLENIRNYVVGIDEPVELIDGTKRSLINFDNAATTPVLTPVMNAVNEELKMYGSIGRGFSQKSDHSTDVYNETREKVKRFVGIPEDESYLYTCVYVDNTTDGLNKLASALIKSKDDIVLTTRIEHHSNDLSWRERCKVIYAEVDELGRVKYDDMERLLKENKVKYVSVTAASNVTGYVTDVHRVAKLAHKYGAKIIVDGAQIVAHRQFSMIGDTPEENIDLFVFSAHKMYTPYGGGAIVGLFEELNKGMPDIYGGGTINIVGDDWENYKQAPASYEAGSPNYASVVGLNKAIDILQEVGFDNIEKHEKELNRRLIDGLKKLDNVIIYGDTENIDDRVGVVTFNFSDINSFVLAQRLKEYGAVATRRGAFCANPYVWRLMGIPDEEVHSFENCADIRTPGMIRISFGIYNTEEEVDRFLAIMPGIMEKAKDLSSFPTPEVINPSY